MFSRVGIVLVYVTTLEFKQMISDVNGNTVDTLSDMKLYIQNTVDVSILVASPDLGNL